jgi:hypothetical protein
MIAVPRPGALSMSSVPFTSRAGNPVEGSQRSGRQIVRPARIVVS